MVLENEWKAMAEEKFYEREKTEKEKDWRFRVCLLENTVLACDQSLNLPALFLRLILL